MNLFFWMQVNLKKFQTPPNNNVELGTEVYSIEFWKM
jgi:hypothetical protein